MIDALELIFSSFWHWLGTFFLLAILVQWRMVNINVIGTKKTKSDGKSSTFWKDLADMGKDKPPKPDPK